MTRDVIQVQSGRCDECGGGQGLSREDSETRRLHRRERDVEIILETRPAARRLPPRERTHKRRIQGLEPLGGALYRIFSHVEVLNCFLVRCIYGYAAVASWLQNNCLFGRSSNKCRSQVLPKFMTNPRQSSN